MSHRSANSRKRPRPMPPLPLHQTPPHIKLRRPPRHPPPISNAPDPIATPLLTPGDRPYPLNRTPHPYTPLAQTPPVITPTPRRTVSVTPVSRHVPNSPTHQSLQSPSDWSGGLFSGHKPLTIEPLHPTPPSAGSDLGLNLPCRERPDNPIDTRVRRLSFGPDLPTPKSVQIREQPSGEERQRTLNSPHVPGSSHGTPRKGASRMPQSRDDLVDVEHSDGSRPNNASDSGQDPVRYECSQREEEHVGDIPESVSPFPDTPPDSGPTHRNDSTTVTTRKVAPDTPAQKPGLRDAVTDTPPPKPGLLDMRTPDDTVVRRCRAPRWDGPITQIPETPTDQLPPREAPMYAVKTAVTAPGEVPSIPESPSTTPLLGPSSGSGRMGLLWLDIGRSTESRDVERGKQDDADDTRLGYESDSASTEPPSPGRKRDEEQSEVEQGRAQVFCRSVRVSIPAGGFRSPSPEPTPPHS